MSSITIRKTHKNSLKAPDSEEANRSIFMLANCVFPSIWFSVSNHFNFDRYRIFFIKLKDKIFKILLFHMATRSLYAVLLCLDLKGANRCFPSTCLKADAWARLSGTPSSLANTCLSLSLIWLTCPLSYTSRKPFWTRFSHPISLCPSPSQYLPKGN